jgi:hypothetical protein
MRGRMLGRCVILRLALRHLLPLIFAPKMPAHE